ncbi:Protein of unknown function [Cotesia congregata]|uniref:Uncharacterized protein n=1 Tax=Cotesia congregata TaxID=51543 RepID=A0A8J2HGU4_COTCN|nr:Protein of unknown function [Cotesia congregata]
MNAVFFFIIGIYLNNLPSGFADPGSRRNDKYLSFNAGHYDEHLSNEISSGRPRFFDELGYSIWKEFP